MWRWRICLPHQYPRVERWLSDMAAQGWRLTEHRKFRFRFQRHEPRDRRFLLMYGHARANEIGCVVRALKSRCHALEIPGGRFTQATLLVLPVETEAEEMLELMQMRRQEHLKHFLGQVFAWFVCTLPMQLWVANSATDPLLRWLGHATLALPVVMNAYASCREVWKR